MSQKYEREIEEILKNLGEFVPEEPLTRRVSRRVDGSRFRRWLPAGNWRKYLTVQWFMVASISLVMLGFLLRIVSPSLASFVNMLGLLLFVAAILMAVLRFGGPRGERRWRGQTMNISYYGSGWWQSLQRRWRLWWGRRRW
jgi:hypothetical protein